MDLNKTMIIGRLTRDPESRTTPNGQNVCSFSVATNRVWTDNAGQKQERVEYHNMVAWGKRADICSQYLAKGSRGYFEGHLQTRDWEGQDGVKRYRTEIIMSNMIMLDRAGAQSGSQFGGNSAPPVVEENQSFNEPSLPVDNVEEEDIKVENIPF